MSLHIGHVKQDADATITDPGVQVTIYPTQIL